MRTLLLAGIAFAVLVPAHAQAAHWAHAHPATCRGTSPKAVVRSYYAAVNHHQAARAEACLTPYYKAQSVAVVDPDWVNVSWIRKLQLRSRFVPDSYLPGNVPAKDMKPHASAEVTAQFTVHYYRVTDSPNGLTLRFIYAVKQTKRSPWRIASIGSGP